MEIKRKCLAPVVVPKITGNLPLLRCGKCSNCMRQKANELSVRAYRQFVGQKNVCFLTFTYRNEVCPIYHQSMVVDTCSGELIFMSEDIVRDCGFFENAPYVNRLNKVAKVTKRYMPWVVESDDSFVLKTIDIYYQTIYYEDFKLLLKRFREKCKPKMKYICCQEYGSVGYRPHYHMLVYGLSDEQIQYLVDDWRDKFGNVDVRYPKSTDAYEVEKMSAYIAKYCNKGSFDCPYIAEGFCLKPKRSVSVGFGLGNNLSDFEQLVNYVLAVEVTGLKAKVFEDKGKMCCDLPVVDMSVLDDRQLSVLADRRKYLINGFYYPFPKYLIKKIFYEKIKIVVNEGVTYRYRATELQKAITAIVLDKLVVMAQKSRERIGKTGKTPNEISEFYKNLSFADYMAATSSDSAFITELESSSIY